MPRSRYVLAATSYRFEHPRRDGIRAATRPTDCARAIAISARCRHSILTAPPSRRRSTVAVGMHHPQTHINRLACRDPAMCSAQYQLAGRLSMSRHRNRRGRQHQVRLTLAIPSSPRSSARHTIASTDLDLTAWSSMRNADRHLQIIHHPSRTLGGRAGPATRHQRLGIRIRAMPAYHAPASAQSGCLARPQLQRGARPDLHARLVTPSSRGEASARWALAADGMPARHARLESPRRRQHRPRRRRRARDDNRPRTYLCVLLARSSIARLIPVFAVRDLRFSTMAARRARGYVEANAHSDTVGTLFGRIRRRWPPRHRSISRHPVGAGGLAIRSDRDSTTVTPSDDG